MLPASLAACVPEFIARPISAWASAGASLVPSPTIATMRPPVCSSRMRCSLSSGRASAMKSSTPASAAIAAAVSGLSPVIITVRTPIARSWAKRSRTPCLTTSERATTPSRRRSSATTSGVPPARAIRSTAPDQFRRHRDRALASPGTHRVAGTLADHPAVRQVDARHARLRAERDELATDHLGDRAALTGEMHDRLAFRGRVGQRGQQRGVAQFDVAHATDDDESPSRGGRHG